MAPEGGSAVFTHFIYLLAGTLPEPTVTAVNDAVSVVKTEASVRVNVLDNDIPAVAENTLTVKETGSSTSTAGAAITYSPTYVDYFLKSGFVGVDTFGYTAVDSEGREGAATVSVTVGEYHGVNLTVFKRMKGEMALERTMGYKEGWPVHGWEGDAMGKWVGRNLDGAKEWKRMD